MSNIFTAKKKTILSFSILGLILFVSFALSFPLITIWSVNTLLFPIFSIPYSWSTYFAMIVIQWIISGGIVYQLGRIKEKL